MWGAVPHLLRVRTGQNIETGVRIALHHQHHPAFPFIGLLLDAGCSSASTASCRHRFGVGQKKQNTERVPELHCITSDIQPSLWQACCSMRGAVLHQLHRVDTDLVWARKSNNTERVPELHCITSDIQPSLWQACCSMQDAVLHQLRRVDTDFVWARKSKNTEKVPELLCITSVIQPSLWQVCFSV